MFLRLGLVPLIISLGACSASRPPWAEGAIVREPRPMGEARQDLSGFAAKLTFLHNRERAAIGNLPPLTWDSQLAAAAAAYAPELARRGELAHSPIERRPGQGENLWMGTRGAYTVEEMVGGWAEEKSLFRAGIFPNVSRNGHWADVAHYTQMIWRSSLRVGCALHRSEQWDFLVCRYAPAGNVIGEPVP